MIFLALKQIGARKKQSLFVLLGIVLGSTAYVVISGLMLGFQQFLLNQLVNNTNQITISARESYVTAEGVQENLFPSNTLVNWITPPSGIRQNQTLYHPEGWYRQLSHDPRVLAFVPQLSADVLINFHDTVQNAHIVGTLPDRQVKVTQIADYLEVGRFEDLKQGGNRIILGIGLAKKLGAALNNTVFLSNSHQEVFPYKVVGIFQTGVKPIDDSNAYAFLNDIQNLQALPNQINGIAVRLKDPYLAEEVSQSWKSLSQNKVESWQEAGSNILSVFKVQDFVRYFMVCSILLVSAFGIYNVLNITITQKKREIAILRAMGYNGRDITTLFLIQGLIFGLLGGMLGIFLGYLGCLYLSTLPAVGDLGSKGSRMLISFNWQIYVTGAGLALVSALISSFIPSRNAGKLTPIAIIRSELSA